MNQPILSTLSALCTRQRLLLVLGFVLLSGMVLFNSLAGSVDVGGWSSGFIHPLHGGDHFLTMLAVGIWAAQLRGKAIWLLPLTFVGVMSLGGLTGAAGLFIPGAEPIILLSGLVFSVFIVRKIRFSSQTNVIIVAFFAFFHGFAHGQEISTSASLISYTLGFMVATLLLHGAGILIVRLLIVVFALFISQLALAQSSIGWAKAQSPMMNDGLSYHPSAETNKHGRVGIAHLSDSSRYLMGDAHPTVHPAPPDNSQYRQRSYSGEDSNSKAVGWAEFVGRVSDSVTRHNSDSICQVTVSLTRPARLPLLRVATVNIAAKWLSADWLDNQRLGIHFLTGVGKTSPPVAVVFDSIPRFCSTAVFCHSAVHGKPITETTPRFDLPNSQTLATRFLTNSAGVTSPPVLTASAAVISLDFNESAVRNSSRFKRSIALPPLFSSHSIVSQTRFKSRSPPFAFLSTNVHF